MQTYVTTGQSEHLLVTGMCLALYCMTVSVKATTHTMGCRKDARAMNACIQADSVCVCVYIFICVDLMCIGLLSIHTGLR